MEILVAKNAGFCFGVKRAINMAQDCAKEATGNIYTLGPIIHNPQVVKELEESGISKVDKVEEINNGTIIVRSHGVTSDEMKLIQEKGLEIIDATCPFVKKAHEYVELLTREGYSVIVVGEKEHPEVKGILSYGRKDIIAAASVEDLKDMPRRKKIGIVAQTTQSIENLQAVVAHCLKKASELKIFNTICNATSVRQQESIELAKQVDCMIVVGGRNSANTNRLTEICRKIQPKTYHIEVPEELNQIQFNGAKNVGITAGASTPNWIIEKVIEALKDRG
ncbi:MAG: 4-hydroxy-3-methylbut-2-enyl diphosphate reductase [Deltaproteobacteria bacterium RIFCSPLOWO2_12_FULL_43_16]|nr:MAG: 4-hydroxy-3-methylbut-2-enyl diphosphate reductase [Deltaproteobacteria bacterium GWA2_43_19]OGQ09305.1 MAG: 4-hydroxy-3-methylbut-2-enyl diphosphate reductase [Deltaproteobacteria bacterium RIFCSPHIGHO2_02_FULL_43_33]OGQ57927.1 MAG: 4-hydroxy-3-methylbut-2-enyl diphosphate reductase [Deltaproteobacteria bacterium RIFCSPLOWO2_12_FULL_43_16]